MIKHIETIAVSSAQGELVDIYKQIKKDFGLVGDIFIIHSLSIPLLAGVWASVRESEMAGSVPRAFKEAVAASVAKANECSFCVDAHSTMLTAVGNGDVGQLIRSGRVEEIADERMKSIVQWALATRSPGSMLLQRPPFSNNEAPEFIGTAVINHYITRMIDVLLTNKALVQVRNETLNSVLRRAIAFAFSYSLRKSKTPGESLVFIKNVTLPHDLRWAKQNPLISRAFASLAAAVDAAGASVLNEEIRSVILKFIGEWDGSSPGMSRKWADQAVNSIAEPSNRLAAKLALLVAIAPYQVDDELVLEVKANLRSDALLLNLLSWSSFAAARTIGSWISDDVALVH